jgi:pyrroline-5-carboxylate reductase
MGPWVAVIGGGNMAEAIVRGAGAVLGDRVVVADPSPERRRLFAHAVETADEAVRWVAEREEQRGSGQVLLAVKPQMLPTVGLDVKPALDDGSWGERVVMSILAGASAAAVAGTFEGRARVIRVMPNTPALIGRGMSALCVSKSATEADAALARAVFAAVGQVIELEEGLFDAFTAVAGSGPAYVFLLAEAMVKGAMAAGMSEGDALLAVRETVAGAGLLLAGSVDRPEVLRARVTSKGGTTAAAIEQMEGLTDLVVRGIVAGRDRGAALARASQGTSLA